MNQRLIFTNLVGGAIDALVDELGAKDVFVLTDTNTSQFVMPLLVNDSAVVAKARRITIPSGDINKNLEQLAYVWKQLSVSEATRSSVLINVGGGMLTDLGGFAAAAFKRGMKCINVPTTLLGAVDASVGGKTAVNFNGLKNQIGVFSEAEASIISTVFFNTLPQQQILSGYAEMLKHALLEDEATLGRLLDYNPVYPEFDSEALLPLLRASVLVKQRIVEEDLTEKGLRKALNLGHTIGHAFESFSFAHLSPVPHGYAVAWGMVAELVLSHMKLGFPSEILHKIAAYVLENYGAMAVECKDYPELLKAMRQDKKNDSPESINFTQLEDVGRPMINCSATKDEIEAALDIYRDLMRLA